jgi:hypothetical protein
MFALTSHRKQDFILISTVSSRNDEEQLNCKERQQQRYSVTRIELHLIRSTQSYDEIRC